VFIKKVGKSQKKRGEKEGRSYFRSPQKYECHSHITPFDKKEWHSSFAPDFGSGAQEWCSKECRSLTHCRNVINTRGSVRIYCVLWSQQMSCVSHHTVTATGLWRAGTHIYKHYQGLHRSGT
jgi:hypothetical protein